ncbi:MAG: hypothetical protein GY762_14380 [Proteobacteria bacterium]|nr:hypothetical protein [Pseudomonadota bacterium]
MAMEVPVIKGMGMFVNVIPCAVGYLPLFFPAVFVNMQIFVVRLVGIFIMIVLVPLGHFMVVIIVPVVVIIVPVVVIIVPVVVIIVPVVVIMVIVAVYCRTAHARFFLLFLFGKKRISMYIVHVFTFFT